MTLSKSPARKALKRWRSLLDELRAVAEQGGTAEHLAELRRARTRTDPALFALTYLSKHLTDPASGMVGLADIHAEWAESARAWQHPPVDVAADRRAEIAPRETGKTTWWFLALPMWGAAHGHVRFTAAFADSSTQAEMHLATFKGELDNNALLRFDYPDLVRPKTRGRGSVEADRVSLYHASSGFVFAAAGADSSNLGIKVGERRPDLIVLDDIEPHEGKYSATLAAKRLDTLQSAILPLNTRARVVLAGTVTMVDSIVHQLVKWGRGEHTDLNAWVGTEKIKVRHTTAIVTLADGSRASVWPEKYPLAYLESIEHTRQYAKNYANDPLGADGDYWTLDDIQRARDAEPVSNQTRVLVSVDPAVTTKDSSDYTGISVVAWEPPPRATPNLPGRCEVIEVRQVKQGGKQLRLTVIDLIEQYNAGLVLVETNQGGDLWPTILWGMPVKVKTLHQTEKKEVRAARVLDHYQRGRVGHRAGAKLADYEGQLVAFPRAPHDDMVDSTGSAIAYFLDRKKKTGSRVSMSNSTYGG